MKVRRIIKALEILAPPHLAAEWDNVGLVLGNEQGETSALMLCIDLTERVLSEAHRLKARMVMAYHPVIFRPISRLTSRDTPVAYAAAAAGVSVYSMHTALDAAPGGTNDVLAEAMGLVDTQPLEPTVGAGGYKLVVFTPPDNASDVADAAFHAGAGRIGNYERCSFFSHGIGTFYGTAETHPTIGQAGRQEATEELRLEMLVPKEKIAAVCSAVRDAHSYETPALDIYPLADASEGCGMGRVGRLQRPVTLATLIERLKKATKLKKLLLTVGNADHHDGRGKLVSVAACGAGAGGSLYRRAAAAGATVFVTGEMRHHDALAASAMGMNVVCLGHSHSERITLKPLAKRLAVILPKLKILIAKTDKDPLQIV